MDKNYYLDKSFFIQPWGNSDEFIKCYEGLFKNDNSDNMESFINNISISNLKSNIHYLILWDNRNDNKAFVLPSLLLIDIIIKIKEKKLEEYSIDSCHILGEIIIRVINLIIDELKKTKKTNNLNMFLVAKEIGLPDYFIEIRHSCTHKNLPSYNTLLFTVYFLFFWVKKNMWDKQYNIFILEKKIFNEFIYCLNHNKSPKKTNFYKDFNKIKFEVNHLFDFVVLFFSVFKNNIEYINKKGKNQIILKNDIDYLIDIYQILLLREGEFLILLFFQFVIEQILILISSEDKIEKYNELKEILIFFTKFIAKYNTLKKFNFDTYEILYQSNYSKLKFINSSENNEFEEILNCFTLIFQGFKEREGYDNILDYQNVILYRLGYIIEKENNKNEEENKDFNLENENNININENNYEEIIIEKPPINTLIL